MRLNSEKDVLYPCFHLEFRCGSEEDNWIVPSTESLPKGLRIERKVSALQSHVQVIDHIIRLL